MLGPVDTRVRQKLRAATPNQRQLASRLGKSQSWVSKYLGDGNVIADPDDLVAIAEFLGTTVGALINEPPSAAQKAPISRKALEMAELWTTATPYARRVREFLEFHHSKRRKAGRK